MERAKRNKVPKTPTIKQWQWIVRGCILDKVSRDLPFHAIREWSRYLVVFCLSAVAVVLLFNKQHETFFPESLTASGWSNSCGKQKIPKKRKHLLVVALLDSKDGMCGPYGNLRDTCNPNLFTVDLFIHLYSKIFITQILAWLLIIDSWLLYEANTVFFNLSLWIVLRITDIIYALST